MKLSKRVRFTIAKHPEYYGTLSEDEKGDWVILPFDDAERHDKLDEAKDAVVEAAWQYYQVQKPLQREQLRQAIATLDELKAVQNEAD